MKPIAKDFEHEVIARLQNAQTCQNIATELHVSKAVVGRVRSILHLEAQKLLGGHPSMLSPQGQCHLAHLITSGQADNASQLKRSTGLVVSTQTIRNALKKEGMKACVKEKKPLQRKSRIKAHLEFARKYQYWTVEDQHHAIWSYETMINHFRPNGRIWVWKKAQERLSKQLIQPTVKFGGAAL